ncbi:MAG: cyclodeaminase/cyclohydrolase family protein [Bacillota bacterium]|nr:cyclodeaminase/cyclohydrolase family protein [Bacillota bacterium]
MLYTDKTCREFIDVLAGKEPVPGGGSVAALVGALGAALGNMVGSLTVGKKKYAYVEEEMRACMEEVRQLQKELIDLVQRDIDIFEPLSKLYGMKADTEEEKAEKERLLEEALDRACQVPLEIMKHCGRAIELSKTFAEKGSVIAVSDAGASAILCKAAMEAASLNVYINTDMMKGKVRAGKLNQECASYLMEYTPLADEVFEYVAHKLRSGN